MDKNKRRVICLILCAVMVSVWPLSVPVDAKLFYGVEEVPKYIVQFVVGEDGYSDCNGTVTVSYTDTAGTSGSVSADLFEGYLDLFPYRSLESNENVLKIQGIERGYALHANQVAMDYTGNFHNDVSRKLDPFSAYTVVLPALPDNLKSIDSVQVKLTRNDSLSLQSLRVIKVSSWPFHTNTDFLMSYMNGLYGSQLEGEWNGHLMAEASGSCKANATTTFSAENRNLTYYPEAERTWINNVRGTMQGVSVHIADVYDAGIEFLLAGYSRTAKTSADSGDKFNAKGFLSQSGSQAYSAYANLDPIVQDCLTLEVSYRDVLGDTRKIEIPFISAYLSNILVDNAGVLCGGKDYTTWISGIFQQNDTVALPLPLAQYESLLGLKLIYGKTAAYSTDNDNVRTIDTDVDTLTVDNICFYEGVTFQNFKQPYNASTLSCRLQTELTPVYSYTAASAAGAVLATEHQLNVTLENGRLINGVPKERIPENTYVFTLTNSAIEEAGTLSSVVADITYVDTNGMEHILKDQDLVNLVGRFYGYTFNFDVYEWKKSNIGMSSDASQVDNRVRDLYQQYDCHMNTVGGTTQFAITVNNVAYFKSVTFHIGKTIEGNQQGTTSSTKIDSWQLSGITVTKATGIGNRYSIKKVDGGPYWMRDVAGDAVAWSSQRMLLQSGVLSQTVFLSYVDQGGNVVIPGQTIRENEDYLDTLPTAMTYQEAMKELGLTVPKHTYQVSVDVADLTDAGSSNYFYFQLIFQNGTSGVVLANQQLSSDSFRQGCVETFQIQTTQNYGELKSVRIICDSAASSSNVFDKLNIHKISVTMVGTTGVSRVWNIENVGWININYTDEGEDYYSGGSEVTVPVETTNVQLIREYAVTGISTAVDLLFCISTASDSKLSLGRHNVSTFGTNRFSATLTYLDSSGIRKEQNFDLINQLQNYNGTDELKWICRPNHIDRFVLSIPDVSCLVSLDIERSDGNEPWSLSGVTVQQIGGLGTVYMSYNSEYIRQTSNAMDLACNDQSGPFTVTGSGHCLIGFTENTITINKSDDNSWDATITREPDTTNDTLNVYLYSGKITEKEYLFNSKTAIKGAVKYTTRYGGAMQTSFEFKQGTMDGRTVMYAEGINVSGMATLNAMSLKDQSGQTYTTVVSYAVIQRVRGDVILDTYQLGYNNFLEFCSQSAPTGEPVAPMYQKVTLISGAGQSAVALTPETYDVAVALRYTTGTSLDGPQKVYQSPYIYLTDQQITMLSSNRNVELDFEVCNLKKIVGLSLVSTGPVFRFDGATVQNFDPQTDNLLGSAVAEEGFSASAVATQIPLSQGNTSTAVFTFVTASNSDVAGAGTQGQVSMVIYYTNSQGQTLHMNVDDLISRLPKGSTLSAGTSTELTVLLPDAQSVEKVILYAVDDDWYLSTLGLILTRSDGAVDQKALRINHWVKTLAPLEVNMLAVEDVILGLNVTGSSLKLGTTASSNGTGMLTVPARPGDEITLRPEVTYSGAPDISCVWDLGQWEALCAKMLNDALTFSVPEDAENGQSFIIDISPAADPSLKVSVVIKVTTDQVSIGGTKVMCVTEGTDVAVEGRPQGGAMIMAYANDIITIQPSYNNAVQLASNWSWDLDDAVGSTRVDGVGQLTWQLLNIPQVGDQITIFVRHNQTQARIGITVLIVADSSNSKAEIHAVAETQKTNMKVTSDDSHTIRINAYADDTVYITPYADNEIVSNDSWYWESNGPVAVSKADVNGRVKVQVNTAARIGDEATVQVIHAETGSIINVIISIVGKEASSDSLCVIVSVEGSGQEVTGIAGTTIYVDAFVKDKVTVTPYFEGKMQGYMDWDWDISELRYAAFCSEIGILTFNERNNANNQIDIGSTPKLVLTHVATGLQITLVVTLVEFDTNEFNLTLEASTVGAKDYDKIGPNQTMYLDAWSYDNLYMTPMVDGKTTHKSDWLYQCALDDDFENYQEISADGTVWKYKLEYLNLNVGDSFTITVTHVASGCVFTLVINIVEDA